MTTTCKHCNGDGYVAAGRHTTLCICQLSPADLRAQLAAWATGAGGHTAADWWKRRPAQQVQKPPSLTRGQVVEARRMYREGVPYKRMEVAFGVSRKTLYSAIKGRGTYQGM